MAAATSKPPLESETIKAIIANLIVERDRLVKAEDVDAAHAIGLAIRYWHRALAGKPTD